MEYDYVYDYNDAQSHEPRRPDYGCPRCGSPVEYYCPRCGARYSPTYGYLPSYGPGCGRRPYDPDYRYSPRHGFRPGYRY